MALLKQKEADQAIFVAPREGMIAPFDFGSDWTEIRFGLFLSGCNAHVEDAASASDELVTVSDVSDLITIGLKNSDPDNLPGEEGSLFVGLKNGTSFGDNTGKFTQPDSPTVPGKIGNSLFGYLAVAGYDGIESIPVVGLVPISILFPDISGPEDYCGFFAMKFVINNRGTSAQNFTITSVAEGKVAGSDYGPAALRTKIDTSSYAAPITLAWNTGSAPRIIPDAFWVRLPFYSNRLMIACMRAVKYQPQ